ncbi:hypothetical protein BC829DRAFT_446392 [Chytridium lagenaria]|nr:hypothetical protein BC829DRAFT_446392 [Chytridium lagenaria]
MSPTTSTALSVMMLKLGNDHNMHFNEEKRCWEGSDEQLILDDEAVAASVFQRSVDSKILGGLDTRSVGSLDTNSIQGLDTKKSLNTKLLNAKSIGTIRSEKSSIASFTPQQRGILGSQAIPFVTPPAAFHEIPPSAEPGERSYRKVVEEKNENPALRALMDSFGVSEGVNGDVLELSLQGCGLGSVGTLDKYFGRLERLDLPRLKKLNLVGNQIDILQNLHSFESLEEVNLSRNCISKINLGSSLMSVRRLKLRGNMLEQIKLDWFEALEELDVAENRVGLVSGGCPLVKLDMSGQNTFRRVAFNFQEFHTLRTLNVRGISLATLSHFTSLYSLTHLDASHCSLTDIDPDFSSTACSHLESLRLSGNKITHLRGLSGWRNFVFWMSRITRWWMRRGALRF